MTQIGAGAFIGSNSALVAPVSIGEGAYVASGSVIIEDVPGRRAWRVGPRPAGDQAGYAKTIRERALAAKAAKSDKR